MAAVGDLMRTFIAAHADQIIVISSVIYIYMASTNAVDGWKPWTFGYVNLTDTLRSRLMYWFELVFLIALTAVYVYAAGYASPRMGALFGFTNLYCIAMPIIKGKIKAKDKNGYTVAGLWAGVLIIAGVVTVIAPLPPK